MHEISFQFGVKAILMNSNGEVLILKINPNASSMRGNDKRNYWDIPGGRLTWNNIERNADGTMAWDLTYNRNLQREVYEETRIDKFDILDGLNVVHANNNEYPGNYGEKVFLLLKPFICSVDYTPDIILSDEHSEWLWTTPIKAAQLLSTKWPNTFTDVIKDVKLNNNFSK